MKKIFLAMLIVFGTINTSFAVDIPETMQASMAHDPIGLSNLLHLVVSLLLVIGMIYVVGWIYAKLNIVNKDRLGKLNSGSGSDNKFKLLQTMSLGQQRNLYSIEMNGKIMLIGATSNSINLLKDFDVVNNEKEVKEGSSTSQLWTVSTANTKQDDSSLDELYKKYMR